MRLHQIVPFSTIVYRLLIVASALIPPGVQMPLAREILQQIALVLVYLLYSQFCVKKFMEIQEQQLLISDSLK